MLLFPFSRFSSFLYAGPLADREGLIMGFERVKYSHIFYKGPEFFGKGFKTPLPYYFLIKRITSIGAVLE